MKKLIVKSTLIASVVALSGLVAQPASAGHGNELIHHSRDLGEVACRLQSEFRTHFSHTSTLHHLLTYASSIQAQANHLNRLAHDPYVSPLHFQTDLRQLDQLALHLHELVNRTDAGYFGPVHGCTAHVQELMKSATDKIHCMEREILAMHRPLTPGCEFGGHASVPQHYGYGRQISFGGGGIRFSFRP